MSKQATLPVAGYDAVKDLRTGAILFTPTSSAVRSIQARRAVKQRIEHESELGRILREKNDELDARVKELESKIQVAMQKFDR